MPDTAISKNNPKLLSSLHQSISGASMTCLYVLVKIINRVKACLLRIINGCLVSIGSSEFSKRPSTLNIDSESKQGRRLRNVFNSFNFRIWSELFTLEFNLFRVVSKSSGVLFRKSFMAAPKLRN